MTWSSPSGTDPAPSRGCARPPGKGYPPPTSLLSKYFSSHNRFSPKEIKKLYWSFKNECPSGLVTQESFHAIYSKFFPAGGIECRPGRCNNACRSIGGPLASLELSYLFNLLEMKQSSVHFHSITEARNILIRRESSLTVQLRLFGVGSCEQQILQLVTESVSQED